MPKVARVGTQNVVHTTLDAKENWNLIEKLNEALEPRTPPSLSPCGTPSPPTRAIDSKFMQTYGMAPMVNAEGRDAVSCPMCGKAVLESALLEHMNERCHKQDKDILQQYMVRQKKRGSGAEPNLDRQCGVLNNKNVPCTRSLTCKTHSMSAKRAVPGRSRPYDELLQEWQRQAQAVSGAKKPGTSASAEDALGGANAKDKEHKKRKGEEAALADPSAAAAADVGTSASAAGVAPDHKAAKKGTAPLAPFATSQILDPLTMYQISAGGKVGEIEDAAAPEDDEFYVDSDDETDAVLRGLANIGRGSAASVRERPAHALAYDPQSFFGSANASTNGHPGVTPGAFTPGAQAIPAKQFLQGYQELPPHFATPANLPPITVSELIAPSLFTSASIDLMRVSRHMHDALRDRRRTLMPNTQPAPLHVPHLQAEGPAVEDDAHLATIALPESARSVWASSPSRFISRWLDTAFDNADADPRTAHRALVSNAANWPGDLELLVRR